MDREAEHGEDQCWVDYLQIVVSRQIANYMIVKITHYTFHTQKKMNYRLCTLQNI